MNQSSKRRLGVKLLGLPLAGLLIAGLGACSADGSGSDGPADSTESADPHSPELTSVTGTMYENAISAQYFLAKDAAKGYGLTLDSTWETDGAAGLAQLVAGDVDILQAAPGRIADAAIQGVGIVIVAGNYQSGAGFVTLEALPGSGITDVKDLAGKTIGLPSTVGIQSNRLRKVLLDAGVDPKSVNFVQLPFGEVPAALQQGTVDAAGAQGAITQELRKIGSQSIFDFGDDKFFKGRVENVWAVTKDFLKKNPNTVAAFQCSIVKGGELANERPNVEDYFRDVLKWNADTIEATASVNSVTKPITAEQIQADFDDLVDIGVEAKPFDLSSILIPYPASC